MQVAPQRPNQIRSFSTSKREWRWSSRTLTRPGAWLTSLTLLAAPKTRRFQSFSRWHIWIIMSPTGQCWPRDSHRSKGLKCRHTQRMSKLLHLGTLTRIIWTPTLPHLKRDHSTKKWLCLRSPQDLHPMASRGHWALTRKLASLLTGRGQFSVV